MPGNGLLCAPKARNVRYNAAGHGFKERCGLIAKRSLLRYYIAPFFVKIKPILFCVKNDDLMFYSKDGVICYCTFFSSKLLQNTTVERLQCNFIVDISVPRLRSVVRSSACDALYDYRRSHGSY